MSKIRTVATVAVLAAVLVAFAGCKKSPTQKAADKTAKLKELRGVVVNENHPQ